MMKQILIITLLLFHSTLYAQEYLYLREQKQWAEMLANGKLNMCNVFVDMGFEEIDMTVPLDSLCEHHFCFVVDNPLSKKFWFPRFFGLPDDKSAFISLELYRLANDEVDEQLTFRYLGELSVCGSDVDKQTKDTVMMRCYVEGREQCRFLPRLNQLYDIKKKGKYRVKGQYKTICKGEVTLHKMRDLFFEVK